MSEEILPKPSEKPFVTVTYDEKGQEAIATNVAPEQRPVILWMLERAKQIVMTQQSEQEKAALIKPRNGFVDGLRRMRR